MRFILALLALICFANCADVALRSVSVKGTLLCGKEPYGNAHVRLYRVSSKGLILKFTEWLSGTSGSGLLL